MENFGLDPWVPTLRDGLEFACARAPAQAPNKWNYSRTLSLPGRRGLCQTRLRITAGIAPMSLAFGTSLPDSHECGFPQVANYAFGHHVLRPRPVNTS